MKRFSLHMKFAVLFTAVIVTLLAANVGWNSYVQERRAEREMLETAQVLARQMDAVWDFMEINQGQFKEGEDGTQSLYCVTAAKAVSRIFTENSDYVIHYTNSTTRKPFDAPDAFELEALDALKRDGDLDSYYGLYEYEDGRTVFRYVEPLHITESCLECHGEPAGELDSKGYPKEGQRIGDVAGVASIVMPTETYVESAGSNIVQESIVFMIVVGGGLAAVFWGVFRLVTSPLGKLEQATKEIEKGNFDIDVEGIGHRDEIEDLASQFGSMATRLGCLCSGLEEQVERRTQQLAEANDELRSQREKLEQANEKLLADGRYKSDFLAIMGHELRTPLTSILAFADIWEEGYLPRDANEAKIVHEIKANSQVILNMVNNILEMARLDAGKVDLVNEPVDIYEVVRSVKGMMQSLAARKRIAFEVDFGRDVPVMYGDGEKIRRILENLISNAIKFTEQGGTVRVSTMHDPRDDSLVVRVEDTGRGVKEEDIPYIFDSFVQGKAPRGHAGGGSGLGLAVVKELVELHGGTIGVESEFGVGSAFVVCVPVGRSERKELE